MGLGVAEIIQQSGPTRNSGKRKPTGALNDTRNGDGAHALIESKLLGLGLASSTLFLLVLGILVLAGSCGTVSFGVHRRTSKLADATHSKGALQSRSKTRIDAILKLLNRIFQIVNPQVAYKKKSTQAGQLWSK